MILLFAGAGASRALSTRYPTTAEFFTQLPKNITGDPLFQNLTTFLRGPDPQALLDIEQVLSVIADLRNVSQIVGDPATPLGWLLQGNRINSVTNAQIDHQTPASVVYSLVARCDHLQALINRKVYDLYSSPPKEAELQATWLPLLAELSTRDSNLQLFTTNYDTVLEHAIDAASLNLATGRRSGPYTLLDASIWAPSPGAIDRPQLTKLHGSVDWSRGDDQDQIFVGTPTFKGDHTKQVIIYPGYKGVPEIQPFNDFHNYFARCLPQVTIAVFIGFAFRDPHINQPLAGGLSTSAKILLVNPAGRLPEEPFGSRTVVHVTEGFGPKALPSLLAGL